MTQEEKAKRYDEALEKTRAFNNGEDFNIEVGTTLCKYIFPELKESKEERIREALIALLKFGLEDGSAIAPGFNETKEQALAWLEKQGKQNEKIVNFKASDWYVNKVDGKIYNAKFMEEPHTNQKRRLEIEKAAFSATGIIEQEEWFIKGAEWSDKHPKKGLVNIERACEWLDNNAEDYTIDGGLSIENLIYSFEKAMEE